MPPSYVVSTLSRSAHALSQPLAPRSHPSPPPSEPIAPDHAAAAGGQQPHASPGTARAHRRVVRTMRFRAMS
jgi:hypothetical protein